MTIELRPAGRASHMLSEGSTANLVLMAGIRSVADETNVYEIVRPDDTPLPQAEAGAHIDLHLANGMTPQYPLVEYSAALLRYLLGIKRDPNSRGGSRFIFETLEPGAPLVVSTPRNHFAP